jgi:hypothetical protein
MNKYLKVFHSLFNFCCDLLNSDPVSYTVNHREIIAFQQLDDLIVNGDRAICDVSLYI